ncbi:MAG TPA: hypothetical protein VNJ70_18500 [Thermoanaerobaculia bacterium]|nr:hypothetical protein [Thermoanaerobaculia bacterium]
MDKSIFAADFLDLLETGEDPPSMSEAEWGGEWKVVSLDRDRHLVLRSWEEPARDRPAAIFTERPIALQCAAVLPLEARPRLVLIQTVAPANHLVLVRDTYDTETRAEGRPIGEVQAFSENQVLALHLAGCFARSPLALALLLEAAGPTAIRLVGEILYRRLGGGA